VLAFRTVTYCTENEETPSGSAKGSPAARQDADGHWTIGGVYVGRKIGPTLFAEPVASRRHLIRSTLRDAGFAVRVGEVFGGEGSFQACLMRGDHVGLDKTLIAAARQLERREYGDGIARPR